MRYIRLLVGFIIGHVEISGTSPNTRPFVLPNGDGTFQIEKYIEYKGVKTFLFREKSVKQ